MTAKRKQPSAEASVPSPRGAPRDVRSPVSKRAKIRSEKSLPDEDETHSSQNDDAGSSESEEVSSQLSESSEDEADNDHNSKVEDETKPAPDPALIMPDFSASHVQKPFANRLASFISSIASSNEQLELAKAAGEAVNADFEIESQDEEDEDQDADEGAGGDIDHADPDAEATEARGEAANEGQNSGKPYIEMDLGLGVLEEQPESEHFENAFAGADRWYNDDQRERDDHLLADLTSISRSTSHNERDKKPGIRELS